MNSKYKQNSNSKLIFLIFFSFFLFCILIFLVYINKRVLCNNFSNNQDNVETISSNISNIPSKINFLNHINDNISKNDWNLSIPKISLQNVAIKEGIDQNILSKYIGHFPNTSMQNGNIGLAAHNRGYRNNYFKDIDKLNIGDEVIYINNGCTKVYKVNKKIEIDSYDWSYLTTTKKDIVTLITCVKDKPNRRLVVQAST